MKPRPWFSAILIMASFCCTFAQGVSCKAEAEVIGSKVVDKHMFVQWRITHNGPEDEMFSGATIHFSYTIHFADKRGKANSESLIIFRETLKSQSKTFTEDHVCTTCGGFGDGVQPAEITSIDVNGEIDCSYIKR